MRDLSPVVPSSVQVVFRTRRCTGDVTKQGTIPAFYTKTIDITDITFTNTDIKDAPKGDGQTLTLRSTALALCNANTQTPTNQTALDDLAQQMAQDLYDYATARFDRLYAGVALPKANGLTDYAEISQDQDGITTRYRSREWNTHAEEYLQFDGPNDANCKDNLTATPPVDPAKTPYVQFASPLITCSNGSLNVPICKLGIEAGRLVLTYVRTDTVKAS